MRRWDKSRERAGKTQAAAGTRSGRPASESKCANCGKLGHTAAECKGEGVDQSARRCFDCNKPGHQARNCPNKGKGVPAKLVASGDAEVILCLECAPSVDEEGFTRVGRPVVPRPVGGTIGDAIELAKANRFKELESKEKKMKKKSKDKLEDNNGSDMSPSDCIFLTLIQSFCFSEVTQTAEVVVRPSGNFGGHGSGALLAPSIMVVADLRVRSMASMTSRSRSGWQVAMDRLTR